MALTCFGGPVAGGMGRFLRGSQAFASSLVLSGSLLGISFWLFRPWWPCHLSLEEDYSQGLVPLDCLFGCDPFGKKDLELQALSFLRLLLLKKTDRHVFWPVPFFLPMVVFAFHVNQVVRLLAFSIEVIWSWRGLHAHST